MTGSNKTTEGFTTEPFRGANQQTQSKTDVAKASL